MSLKSAPTHEMLKRIEKGLHQALAIAESKTAPQNLQKALHHSIFPGGARIRPQLCLAVATACGDDDPALSTAAASAIELLHCASLVHDDLPCFDNALVRRGQASVHAAFGERLAVLAGDALIVLAFQYVASCSMRSPLRLAPVLRTIATSVGAPHGIVAGQAWECESKVQLKQYQKEKTGSLFEAATAAGAQAAGADADTWKPLGEWLGEAYQVADDIRDVLADQAMMGKPQGQDITHDRPSSARDLGLVGAVQHFDELVYKAINSIPSCKGEKMLRGLVAKEAERLIPESWFANTNRPLHHHATV
ncbi:MAG: polyprenyl synthetase family protein [Burkholderiales bacterium]|jgi:geranylgeranyl diphosphate synthase, type II|uniref:Polyprenyl synthetase family protein n=1 Tax=Polynucleobacter sp. UK-FUSCHL-C3 TaxID=2955208 RepID=A0AAU8A0U6_9BURK|nr:polyprenyl synthetase family protein [Burkholderiales bacterium]